MEGDSRRATAAFYGSRSAVSAIARRRAPALVQRRRLVGVGEHARMLANEECETAGRNDRAVGTMLLAQGRRRTTNLIDVDNE